MGEKYLFDKAVLNYEKRRPNYGTELFKDVIKYAEIGMGKSLLEVGCGTGQATEPFLKINCKVTAVELGENLAAYTKEKFKAYDNFSIVRSAFEDYDCEDNKFDMLYSATAFHWIPDEIGYKKAYRLIKSGGTIALFWNRPAPDHKDSPLHQKIQSIYRELLPEWSYRPARNEERENAYLRIKKDIEQNGFTDVEFKLYHNSRKMTGAQYIELLTTYSDHIALENSIQSLLFNRIRKAIEEFGNEITIYDTVDLYLGKKPEIL